VIHAAPGTIVIYSDLVCSFAHLAVHRLHRTRAELDLEAAVAFDHRAFPLERFNQQVHPRPGVDSELAVLGGRAPDAGWAMWHAPDWAYPSTVLPALEAVQAAKEQSWTASEVLDLALRRAFWADSRCIAQRHVILDVARAVARRNLLDVDRLADTMDSGRPAPPSSPIGGPREAAGCTAPLTCSCPTAPTSRTRASPPAGSTATSASGSR
jgi:predicted DsbA family dithiol-disulfide isomerase